MKIRFPSNRPISDILTKRYGVPILRKFRQLETIVRRRDKAECDLDFLTACEGYKEIPKFLRIRLYKKQLEKSKLCKSWQLKLLNNEIASKNRRLHQLRDEADSLSQEIKNSLSSLDYSCLNLWLQRKQRSFIEKTKKTHEKKLNGLGISPIKSYLDPDKVIHNISDHNLTSNEIRIFMLGLDFALPIHKLNFYRYHLIFENLFNKIENFKILENIDNAKSIFKNQLKSIVSRHFTNFKGPRNRCPVFNANDMKTLKNIANNKDIYVTRPDKGNGVVILNRVDYTNKILEIINDFTKFQKTNADEKKLIIKLEDKLNNSLRNYKKCNIISDEFYRAAYTSGSNLGRIYGLPKTHKTGYPLRPILSACSMHNFKLAKQIVPMISHLANTKYSVRNSHEFVSKIKNLTDANNYFMCSFDVQSLYTNVPLNEALDILITKIFDNNTAVNGITKDAFNNLVEMALCDSYFNFNGNIYKQIDGLAMGSPLSPIVANVFLDKLETEFLNDCPAEFKPKFYLRYLDDTFILFNNADESKLFLEYCNSKHSQINFTCETETNDKLAFLDVTVSRENNTFITSVYRKKTFSGQCTNYFSYSFLRYKIGSIYTLINRAFNLSTNYEIFHKEIEFLRSMFISNNYPNKLFNRIVKRFLDRKFSVKQVLCTANKQPVFLQLPYIGRQTDKLKLDLDRLLAKFYPQIQPKYFFRNSLTICSFFKKYEMPEMSLRTSVVYKYVCDHCQGSYIGSTALQMFRRCAAHGGYSFRTNRPLAVRENSSIREHCENSNHSFKLGNFSILDSINCSRQLRILESLYIFKQRPTFNDNQSAVFLHTVN